MTTASDIEAAAADWLARIDDLGPADTLPADFVAWCERDPRHRAAYLRLEAAWKKADRLKHLRAFDGPVDMDLLSKAARNAQRNLAASRQTVRWRYWPAAAAAAAFVLGLAAWLLVPREQVYRTSIGGFERVVLEDGSAVELNTDSEIRVRFADDRRRISLVRGQAHFKVAHDARRPFDVIAGSATVRAVGTAFAVRLRDRRQIEVVVTEGRVAIATQNESLSAAAGLPATLPTLVAGEVAVIEPSMPVLETEKIESADLGRRLAWTEGLLKFDGQTLAEAVAEFNRYNHTKLSIADPSIADLSVGGSFKATDPESFVSALESSFRIHASALAPGVVALSRSRE